jgi:hypothetical protein
MPKIAERQADGPIRLPAVVLENFLPGPGKRRHVAKAELDAEMVELDELGTWADELEAPAVAGSAIERATAAMETVVQSYFGGPVDSEAAEALEAIATAAARCSEVR